MYLFQINLLNVFNTLCRQPWKTTPACTTPAAKVHHLNDGRGLETPETIVSSRSLQQTQ
jgi:hypothetical protein